MLSQVRRGNRSVDFLLCMPNKRRNESRDAKRKCCDMNAVGGFGILFCKNTLDANGNDGNQRELPK